MVDCGAGSVRAAKRVEHHEVVDDALEPHRGHRHPFDQPRAKRPAEMRRDAGEAGQRPLLRLYRAAVDRHAPARAAGHGHEIRRVDALDTGKLLHPLDDVTHLLGRMRPVAEQRDDSARLGEAQERSHGGRGRGAGSAGRGPGAGAGTTGRGDPSGMAVDDVSSCLSLAAVPPSPAPGPPPPLNHTVPSSIG